MDRYNNAVEMINSAMMWVTGFITVIMGIVITYDVFARYFFNSPLWWGFEFDIYACAAIGFLSGGYALLLDRHVKVDIIYLRFSARTKAILDLITSPFFFLLAFVLIWFGFSTVLDSFYSNSTTGGPLNPPLYLIQALIPLGGILIGLQGVSVLLNNIKLVCGESKRGEKR